jgi:phosphoserine aminotransferase
VLERIQREFVDYQGSGMSLIEASHRGADYEAVHTAAISRIRSLLNVPEQYHVLLLGGGATLQFGMVPMNLITEESGPASDIVFSGAWAKKAMADAKKFGTVNVLFDGSASSFTTLPAADAIEPTPGTSYAHLTSNETIEGLQWKDFPAIDVPLVADMSSDILSRPVPVDRFGVIYAGAQKNLGPAGVTVVIVRDDLLARASERVPAYLTYRAHAGANSLYNTPPVFPIWVLSAVLEWIETEGGVGAVATRNERKAQALYQAIDESDGFYRCPVGQQWRSTMNVVFRLPTEELEAQFVAEATASGMSGLKGHRSVGGIRASIYNAMPEAGVEALIAFMKDFRTRT